MNPLLQADDLKKQIGALRVTKQQSDCLWYTKLVFAGLFVVSSVISLIMVLADPGDFTLKFAVTRDYRDGAALATDLLPTINTVQVGTFDLGLTAALTSVFALVAYGFSLFVHSAEVSQMNGGSNPYAWVTQMLWVPLVMLTIAGVSGIANAYNLASVALFSWVWLLMFWWDDHSHSYEYIGSMLAAGDSAAAASLFSWIPFFFAIFFALVDFGYVFLYTGFMFAAPTPPSRNLLGISITLTIAYLLTIPLVSLLYRARWWVKALYQRDLTIYIAGGVIVLLTTWVSIIVISVITP